MTRINIVPVESLSDQHLFAEWRELPRMASYATKAVQGQLPARFVLGTGHVRFFLNKATWLENRHKRLTEECLARGIKLSNTSEFVMNRRFGDVSFQPSDNEIKLSQQRIDEKLAAKPSFYKWTKR